MAKILRGEIRWADQNPTVGREQSRDRPVLNVEPRHVQRTLWHGDRHGAHQPGTTRWVPADPRNSELEATEAIVGKDQSDSYPFY